MKSINLQVEDDYFDNVFNFLKMLPENVVKIDIQEQEQLSSSDKELIKRIDDIKNNKVETLTKKELFNDL